MGSLSNVILLLEEDGNEYGLKSVEAVFGQPGSPYHVINVAGDQEAVALLQVHSFDVFIISTGKNNDEKRQFCRDVFAKHRELPLILLTESDDPMRITQALEDGVNTVLYKGEYSQRTLLASIIGAIDLRSKSIIRERLDQQISRHDELTGLLNLSAYLQLLQESLAAQAAHTDPCDKVLPTLAILRIDIDRSDDLLGSLGRKIYDLLLVSVAARIPDYIDGDFQLARLGENSFAVTMSAANEQGVSVKQLTRQAEYLLNGLSESFDLVVEEVFISVSIGVALSEFPDASAEKFVAMAERALKHAKEEGGSCSRVYSDEYNEKTIQRLHLARDLRYAIERNELHLYYQPLVDKHSGRVRGAEALLRWIRPDGSCVPPETVILLAEESGLINSLGQWILKCACETAVQIHTQGRSDFEISVNISVRQVTGFGFYASVVDVLKETGLKAQFLTLEITETAFMTDIEKNRRLFQRLAALGITISIDDFGTGYSSLHYLSRLPVKELKIDRSFVNSIADSERDLVIVQVIVVLAHKLGMHIVAEGVETHEQWQILQQYLGVRDRCQGYFFAKPMPKQDFLASKMD